MTQVQFYWRVLYELESVMLRGNSKAAANKGSRCTTTAKMTGIIILSLIAVMEHCGIQG